MKIKKHPFISINLKGHSLKGKRNREFYYTNEQMVKDLLFLTPIKRDDSILDAGSGKNKVWFLNLNSQQEKYECEIEDGIDFLTWDKKVDWVVGNPPFHQGWLFLDKASNIATKGIAFLGNINFFNCLTTRRLSLLKQKGFHIHRIHIISDKRWFGRYYYIIFLKEFSNFISWNSKSY